MTAPMTTTLRLAELLEEKRISQSEVARRVGMSFQAINHLCSGRAKAISFETLDLLAGVLEVAPGDLFTYVPPKAKR